MKIVHLVAIAIACGDSLSSPLAQRASPNLDPDLLDDIRFHAPQDDTPEQVVDFLKTDADFQETYPEAGKALAIRAQEPGLKPSHRVPVAVSCITCMTSCMLSLNIGWISGTQDPTTLRYLGGTQVDNTIYRDISVCGVQCALEGSCTNAQASTWQAEQDLSGMVLGSKRDVVA